MNNRKPIIATLLVAGLVTGGAGVASAQYGGDAEVESDTVTETSEEQVENTGLLQVQEELDGAENTDGEDDGERDGRRGRNRGHKLSTAAEVIGIEVDELRSALRSFDSLSRSLDEKPNSLLFGRDSSGNPTPKARR